MNNMEEIWKDIAGYEGLYQVSNLGNVKSFFDNNGKRRDHILSGGNDTDGYKLVLLYKDKKRSTKRVHRLVAEAFLPNPDNLPQVNHKDEDKSNNCVDNLEYCSLLYNIRYGTGIYRHGLKIKGKYNNPKSSKKVVCIETGITYPSAAEAGRQLNIASTHIIRAIRNKNRTAGKYHWDYAE